LQPITLSVTKTQMREAIIEWNSFIGGIKGHLDKLGCIEVSTPILNEVEVPNQHIRPFSIKLGLPPYNLFLHTSPELKMKELLSQGSGDIYQICPTFRDEEMGSWHSKEFQMLEWYRLNISIDEMIKEVNELLLSALSNISDVKIKIRSISYKDLFYSFINEEYPSNRTSLIKKLRGLGVEANYDIMNNENLCDLIFSIIVKESFDDNELVTITKYPEDQASMASLDNNDESVSTRFECFYKGIELSNGYEELRDMNLLSKRFAKTEKMREIQNNHLPKLPKDYLVKVSSLLPVCCGVSVGLNRLYALSKGLTSIPTNTIYR
jgi:elongation factor P--(R)-beta-lysine ligase